MAALQSTGLQEDCPFSLEEGAEAMSPESAEEVSEEAFAEYAGRLNSYLQARPRPALHRAGLMYIKKLAASSEIIAMLGWHLWKGCPAYNALCLVPPLYLGLVCVPCQGSLVNPHANRRGPSSCSTQHHARLGLPSEEVIHD